MADAPKGVSFEQPSDIEMVDAPNAGGVSREDRDEDTEQGKKYPENDQSASDPGYHYETDSEGWASNPETEDGGLLEDESLAGGRPVMHQQKLRRQNTPVFKDNYIQFQRDSHINMYNQLQRRRDQLKRQQEEMESTDVTSSAHRYSRKFLKNTLEALNAWIGQLDKMIDTIADDAKGWSVGHQWGTKSYPWDGKLVQQLVKTRTQLYEKVVKQAESIRKRSRRTNKLVENTSGELNQHLQPQFTREDLIKLLRKCPSTDHNPWLKENIGLRYLTTNDGRIKLGTLTSTITREELGWADKVWEKIKPLGKTKTPVSLPQYFAPDTGLMRAKVFLTSNSFLKKYPHNFLLILAILPPQYCSFLHAFKKDPSAPVLGDLLSHIVKTKICLCPRNDNGSVLQHKDHFSFYRFPGRRCQVTRLSRDFESLEFARPGTIKDRAAASTATRLPRGRVLREKGHHRGQPGSSVSAKPNYQIVCGQHSA